MFYTRSSFFTIGGMMMLRFGRCKKKKKKKNDRNRNLAVDRNIVIKKVIKGTSVLVYVYMNEVQNQTQLPLIYRVIMNFR